ncbi:MAG: N-6 DNA methylase [Calditrichaeota bacterium]|nr:N-6 DNA methylase [Calditrichota bacterium]
MSDAIKTYVKTLSKALDSGLTTEHTHRSTLEALIKALGPELQVLNEPKRIHVGSPDLVIRKTIARGHYLPLGYIETKDVGDKLDATEKSEQLQRYKRLSNLILTDYLEFRWFVDGKNRLTVSLAKVKNGKVKLEADGEEQLLNLLSSFLNHPVEDICSPKELAAKMAGLCKNIDGMISNAFAQNGASELMQDLKSAFERTLLPDITNAQFADMFAQTLGYGLFAARIHHASASPSPFTGKGQGDGVGVAFTRTAAAREIPKSNPFLRNLFETMHSTALEDEPFIGFVDDLTAVLAHTDIGAVLKHFGKRTKQEDPILHFYETFLSEYDPKERKRRGVYYTPEPVVSYIVRSVDILLKEKFGLKDGLADTSTIEVEVKEGDKFVKKTLPKVLILDPACGTGTFLYSVVDLIRNRFMEQNRAGEWQAFVKEQLIPRIYGFELQMAPYAVAHLKLAMQLAGHDLESDALRKKWGYEFDKDERLNVYLTNSLEESFHKAEQFFGSMRIITQETNAAATIKNRLPIMVVLGNPPYAGHSANRSEITEIIVGRKVTRPSFIGEKLRTYYRVDGRPLNEKNPKWLQDDYVKFLRYGQWRIAEMHLDDQPAKGILAFITNHSYLDNPTFRGMRRSLQTSFDDIFVLDLHGNSKKRETAPDGGKDENVFDIMQGVTIGVFVKTRKNDEDLGKRVHRADVWGKREVKYDWLGAHDHSNTEWTTLEPSKPFYLFTEQDSDAEAEYNQEKSIQKVFEQNSVGIVTARDDLVVHWNAEDAFETARRFSEMGVEEARASFDLGADVRD